VHTRATGLDCAWAIPNATKAALLSSLIVLHSIFFWRANDIVNGALREPGQSTAFFIPFRAQISLMSMMGWRRT